MTFKKGYVLGFYFSEDYSKVVLILKLKDDWQYGFLNGLGGSIESNESAIEAMVREFKEEAGKEVTNWKYFATMTGIDWIVSCFVANGELDGIEIGCNSGEGEVLILDVYDISAKHILYNLLPNLEWLIPLALSKQNITTVIDYTKDITI